MKFISNRLMKHTKKREKKTSSARVKNHKSQTVQSIETNKIDFKEVKSYIENEESASMIPEKRSETKRKLHCL